MDNTRFASVYIDTTEDGFHVHQTSYAEGLKPLPEDCTFRDFRSCRAQLAWLIHTRPDISYEVSMAAQVTEKTFDIKHVAAINKVIGSVREKASQGQRCSAWILRAFIYVFIRTLHLPTTMI